MNKLRKYDGKHWVIDPEKVPVKTDEPRPAGMQGADIEFMATFEPIPRPIDLTQYKFSVKVDKKDKSILVLNWKKKSKRKK